MGNFFLERDRLAFWLLGGYKFCFILHIALNLLYYCLKIIDHVFSNTTESCRTLKTL